jgi:hypothetical protein
MPNDRDYAHIRFAVASLSQRVKLNALIKLAKFTSAKQLP